MPSTTLSTDIDRVVPRSWAATPTAAKRGRNPRWPYVPVIRHPEVRGVSRTEQVMGRAYATRDQAVAAAAEVIAFRRGDLARKLADPRHRALRESYGLPRG